MNKLMNVDEAAPHEFFIFVDQFNWQTQHNFRHSGKFFSAGFASFELPGFLRKYLEGTVRYLPYEPCAMEPMAVTPYFLTAINDYRVEYDIEVFREKHCRLFPSRLSALYAFGSEADCVEVSHRYGWQLDSVRRFKLLDHPLNRVVRVNMEHVSLARHAYKASQFSGEQDLWRAYWSGHGNVSIKLPVLGESDQTLHSGVIWEYLIEGVVEHQKSAS